MLDELESVFEDELVWLDSFLLLEEVLVVFFLEEEVAGVFFLLCFVELVLEVCSVFGVSTDESESSVGDRKSVV